MAEHLPRSRGDTYALAALRNRRASIASEIVQLEAKLRHCRESLVHVDATLRRLDPQIEPGSIPNKRPVKRIKLFRQGQPGRMIRDADEAISTRAVVDHVLAAGGHGRAPGGPSAAECAGTSPTSSGDPWWSRLGTAGTLA